MKLSDVQNLFKWFGAAKYAPSPQEPPAARKSTRGRNVDRVLKQYRHPGSHQRQYRIYIPKGYSADKKAPLIMVLHGCQQTHRDIQSISGFDELADKHHFIVVYPYVTQYNDMRMKNCWGWWRPEHTKAGLGEVEDLWCIVEEIASDFAVDLHRVHVTGLSSGGGMAVAALTVHAGRFASGAVIAGVSYGERALAIAMPHAGLSSYRPIDKTVTLMEKARKKDRTPAPLFIVHSHNDSTVDIRAGKNLRDSWLTYFGFEKKSIKKIDRHQEQGSSWTHKTYGKKYGKSIVETVFIQGPGHGWYGGRPGEFSFPGGPPISNLMWRFFKDHRLAERGERSATWRHRSPEN
ncbi:MAG: PHB depolymerase family esterase [Agarilytica sp.]